MATNRVPEKVNRLPKTKVEKAYPEPGGYGPARDLKRVQSATERLPSRRKWN
jgi:hypothetical protein